MRVVVMGTTEVPISITSTMGGGRVTAWGLLQALRAIAAMRATAGHKT
jgi:hypothetical protein